MADFNTLTFSHADQFYKNSSFWQLMPALALTFLQPHKHIGEHLIHVLSSVTEFPLRWESCKIIVDEAQEISAPRSNPISQVYDQKWGQVKSLPLQKPIYSVWVDRTHQDPWSSSKSSLWEQVSHLTQKDGQAATVKCCGRVSNETEKKQTGCVWGDEAETN